MTETLTVEDLVQRARELVPALKERAAEAERLRQIPAATVEDLIKTGVMRVGNPDRYGGIGIDYDAMYEMCWELGRACGSTSWCYSIWTLHTWIVGHFPEEGQEEYFSNGADTLCSSAFTPAWAEAEPVSGGLSVSGRWRFSSGCDAASWAMLGIPSPNRATWILVPRRDYQIDDTWFVSGMCGTGSKDIVIEKAFVPNARILDSVRAGDGDWTGWELHGRPTYRVPLRVLLGFDLAAPLVGIGQGAVDEFISRLAGTTGPGRTAESMAIQLRLAESAAEVDTARLVHRSAVRELMAKARRGEGFSETERARIRRDKAFVAQLCVRAVNRLFDASGGHALFATEPIQRFHRDAHAASHQGALNWDAAAEQYGKTVLTS